MSQVEKPCLFDNTVECPAREALEGILRTDLALGLIVEKACPVCPIRLKMIPSRKIK